MGTEPALAWGNHSLILNLPAVSIGLTGLSESQHSALSESYRNLIPSDPRAGAKHVNCKVIRLSKTAPFTRQDLISNPLKSSHDGVSTFKVSGVDFEAELNVDSADSFLGVVHEHELAQPTVIENYLRILSAHNALVNKGALLHSAGLVVENKAYIFCGRSNAGKTTLARKAHEHGATILSDDINLILPAADGAHYNAYAVPFTGEFGRTLDHSNVQASYPLAGIVFLEQADRLELLTVSPSQAVARLLVCCPFVNTDEIESERLFGALARVVASVPVTRLRCLSDDRFDSIFQQVKKHL